MTFPGVMAGLVPAIHRATRDPARWMPGTRPGMTQGKIAHHDEKGGRATLSAHARDGGHPVLPKGTAVSGQALGFRCRGNERERPASASTVTARSEATKRSSLVAGRILDCFGALWRLAMTPHGRAHRLLRPLSLLRPWPACPGHLRAARDAARWMPGTEAGHDGGESLRMTAAEIYGRGGVCWSSKWCGPSIHAASSWPIA
jgi:hypothetical protein